MNPDLGSGRSISYEAHFKHAILQVDTSQKIADSPVLRGKSKISLENVSDSEQPSSRIYKKNISRDTEQHLPSPCKVPETVGLHRFQRDRQGTSPDQKSGQAI